MKKQIFGYTKIIILALVLVTAAAYVKAWTGPTLSPPNGNVPAPINVGNSIQTKLGSLVLNAATPIQNAVGLTVSGTSIFNGSLQIMDGTQGDGKVLTSDASGNASWATGGGSSSVTSGGNSTTGYWYQIGNMLIEGGMAYPGTAKSSTSAISVTFPKPFSVLASLQFTPLNSGTFGQVHPEMQVMVTAITTTGFKYQTINNNGGSWFAIGSI